MNPLRYFRRRPEDSQWKHFMLLAGWLVLAIGAFDLTVAVLSGSLLDTVAAVAVCTMAVNFFISPRLQRHAFRAGYFKARESVFHSFYEARSRGMDIDDWITAEQERDVLTMIAAIHDP